MDHVDIIILAVVCLQQKADIHFFYVVPAPEYYAGQTWRLPTRVGKLGNDHR